MSYLVHPYFWIGFCGACCSDVVIGSFLAVCNFGRPVARGPVNAPPILGTGRRLSWTPQHPIHEFVLEAPWLFTSLFGGFRSLLSIFQPLLQILCFPHTFSHLLRFPPKNTHRK